MVRLVPPFLRNIIGSTEEQEGTSTINTDHEQDISKNSDKDSYGSVETLDTVVEEKLESMQITSNIATIASIDWGPPKLNLGLLDELGQSGKYIIGRITGNKPAFENPEDITKNIKNVPKVYESDFNVYLNQIDKIYSEYGDFNILGDNSRETNESGEGTIETSIDGVAREYFEDDYQIPENKIFNKDLDQIPESIEYLESQLMIINNQLRELVGTHLKHVSESFVCIEDLKNAFLDVHTQISNVRDIFDNLKGIYNSPVEYKHLRESRTRQEIKDTSPKKEDQMTSMSSSKSLDLQAQKDEGTYNLHEVLIFKKRIIEVLDYLKILRGVSCIPEYIQGIVEINNMALARIFASASLEYFQGSLSKFTLTNSVTLVVKDTMVNLERVAEAKLIDLTFFAITECYTCKEQAQFERELRGTMEKIEPILIVLTISGLIGEILSTLESTKISPVDFNSKGKIKIELFEEELQKVLLGFKNSNFFIIQMFGSITCIYLHHLKGEYIPEPSRASKIVEKMIFKIQESFTNGINRDYQKITETTNILKTELNLPQCCKSNIYLEYNEKLFDKKSVNNSDLNDLDLKGSEKEVNSRGGTGDNGNECPEGVKDGDYADDDEKQTKDNENEKEYEELDLRIEKTDFLNINDIRDDKEGKINYTSEDESNNELGRELNDQTEDKGVSEDLRNYWKKLNQIVENGLKRSVEDLFLNLELKETGDLMGDSESSLSSINDIQVIYKNFVSNITNSLELNQDLGCKVVSEEFKEHGGELKEVKRFSQNKKKCKLGLEKGLMEVFHKFAKGEVKKKVESLFEQSLVKIHENLLKETWDQFEKVVLEEKKYNLIESSVRLNEHLNIYFGISEKLPFMASTTVSKAINLFAYFNTLIENELEKNLCVKKLCLIIQTLDFFSQLIPVKIRKVSTLNINTEEPNEEDENNKNYDLLVVLGSNAENCVLEAKILRKKSSDLLSNFMFSQIKIHLINWVFKYTDLQEEGESEDATQDVDMVTKTIGDLYEECSEMLGMEDLKTTFSESFDKLVQLVEKQNVDLSNSNKFSDDCTRIITNLSHLKEIKLEILSLAHRLSN